MNERQLIERYFNRPHTGGDVVVGIGDDAAVLNCSACAGHTGAVAVTADTLVEGRHFSADAAAEDVGHKALAVSLSDLAAMGAAPRWATLCLSLPDGGAQLETWIAGFARGFFALARRWDVSLVGGDLVRGPRTVTVQAGGGVRADAALLRSGARVGEGVYLTGTVGDAGLVWRGGTRNDAEDDAAYREAAKRLHRPEPRVEEGRVIARFASAAIDVSDGLLRDLLNLAQAGDVTMQLEVENVPLGASCRARCRRPADWAQPLTGGDDYELLFTMDDARRSALEQALARPGGVAVTRVGRVAAQGAGLRCRFRGEDWPLPEKLGFDHFDANFC